MDKYPHFNTDDGCHAPYKYDSIKIIREGVYIVCIFRYCGTGYIRWNIFHKGTHFPLSLDAVPPHLGELAEKEIEELENKNDC